MQPSELHLPPKLLQCVAGPFTRRLFLTSSAQRSYEAAFHTFKPDKRLRWLQSLGTATVKLELADRLIEVEVTPLQASIAEHFESTEQLSTSVLALALGGGKSAVDERMVEEGLTFWKGLGVVKEVSEGVWRMLEIAESEAMERELSSGRGT